MIHKYLRILFIVGAGCALCSAIGPAQDGNKQVFKGKKLLLIAAISSPTGAVDANIKKHFESLGMTVNMVSDTNPPSAEGYALVFLASDIKAKTITNTYRGTGVPVLTT